VVAYAHLTFSLIRGDEKARAFALARPADVYLINPEGLKWLHKYLRAIGATLTP
jgi:hypothetical protein